MPLPKPNKDESKDEFMDRCMGDEVMVKEYEDEDQRYAVCESQWDKSKEKKANYPGDIERRVMAVEDVELRVEGDDDPKILGYAAKFNKWSLDLGGFTERIKSGAFDEALEKSDVRALKNHDPNLILGRTTSKTLRLKSNTVGLNFEVDMPNTSTGRDVVEEIRRKDITGCSFAFTTLEDDWKFLEDGTIQRTIIKVGELFDVGPVTYPAYPDTTVAARSLDAFKKNREVEVREAKETEQSKDDIEQKAKTYECECVECGFTDEYEEHCKDVKCPECGGDMRRKSRPGSGRSKEEEPETIEVDVIDDERKRQIERDYRKAERIGNRCKLKIERIKSAEV